VGNKIRVKTWGLNGHNNISPGRIKNFKKKPLWNWIDPFSPSAFVKALIYFWKIMALKKGANGKPLPFQP